MACCQKMVLGRAGNRRRCKLINGPPFPDWSSSSCRRHRSIGRVFLGWQILVVGIFRLDATNYALGLLSQGVPDGLPRPMIGLKGTSSSSRKGNSSWRFLESGNRSPNRWALGIADDAIAILWILQLVQRNHGRAPMTDSCLFPGPDRTRRSRDSPSLNLQRGRPFQPIIDHVTGREKR